MAMKTIVALLGPGIGPEVVNATCELLMGTGLPLKMLTPPQCNPCPKRPSPRPARPMACSSAWPARPHQTWCRGSAGR